LIKFHFLGTITPSKNSPTPDQVGDLSPKGRVAEGNDKMDSTIIKIISDLPGAASA
jgi:hypothetical protein